MLEPTTYEIVLRGRPSASLLRPLLDEFSFDHSAPGVTRLTGPIRDAAHLHGLVAHLTAVHVELVSIAPGDPDTSGPRMAPDAGPGRDTEPEPDTDTDTEFDTEPDSERSSS